MGGILGFVLFAVLTPLLVREAGELAPCLGRCLLRWGARRIGAADQAGRYQEEWLADLERVPGNLAKLAWACGVLIRSVPRLRAQFREERRARRHAILTGRTMNRLGKQVAGSSLEIGVTLQHMAEVFVPQFADHCLIDLFEGDALVRHVQRHASGWTPPPGTWAQVGEQIRYPDGHFCQQALERRDAIVADLLEDDFPAPSAGSLRACEEVALSSVLASPLYAHGELLGVMSLALSSLTSRTERHYSSADRDAISMVAGRVAIAIDKAAAVQGAAPGRAGPSSIWHKPQAEPRAFTKGIIQSPSP